MNAISRTAVLALLLSSSVAFAGPRPGVSKAIGGKTMPGYKTVSGAALKLRAPWRKRAGTPPADGPSLLVTGRNGQQVRYLDGAHYRDVRTVALKLMRTHRPEKHFYIALGRSPVAIASFLAELNPNMVMTFPASDLRLGVDASWKQQYFDHFEQLIPDDVLRGERTVVFFDRSHNRSGTSLAKLQELLSEYLQIRNGKPVPVKAVGLAAQGPLIGQVEHLSTAEHPSTFQYFSGLDNDEEFAPFRDKHRIGVEPLENINENPNHWPMRDALKQRMAHDKELEDTLRKEFGDLLKGDADAP